jgi:hypothetical protein
VRADARDDRPGTELKQPDPVQAAAQLVLVVLSLAGHHIKLVGAARVQAQMSWQIALTGSTVNVMVPRESSIAAHARFSTMSAKTTAPKLFLVMMNETSK